MAEPSSTVETENGWEGEQEEDERKPAAAPVPAANAPSPGLFATDQSVGGDIDDDEGQGALDVHDVTLLTQQPEPSDRGEDDDYYSTDDGYRDDQLVDLHPQLLTQEDAGADANAGDYHHDELGSISADGFMPVDDEDDVSSSGSEDGSAGDDSSSSSASSDDDSDESAARLEKDLRDVDAASSPAGATPRIVRNRRRAIARNEERLRLLMEGVERPGAPAAGAASAGNGDAAGEASHPVNKKRRIGRTNRKSKSPGKGHGAKIGKRRGMLFPTRYNGVEPPASSALGGSATAAASPIGLSQSSHGSTSALVAQQQQQTYTSIAEEVGNRFPHREPQIRLLCGVFERTMRQTGGAAGGNDSGTGRATTDHDVTTLSDGSFVPSPVFVTGPSGAGKTSVVRDILQCIKRRHADTTAPVILSPLRHQRQQQKSLIAKSGGVGMGYINCLAMEGSAAGAFLEEAYKQILRSFFASSSRKPSRRSRKRKRHGASPKRQVNGGADDGGATNGHVSGPGPKSTEAGSTNQNKKDGTPALEEKQQGKPPAVESKNGKANGKHVSISPAKAPASRHISLDDEEVDPVIDPDDDEDGFGDIEDQIEQQKKEHLRTKMATQQADGLVGGGGSKQGDSTQQQHTRRQHTISTPADFGRALLPLCGGPDDLVSKSRYCGCAFLVLDHADRLLSMTAKQNSPYNAIGKDERNNLLSQLLLLPRVMGLNLTIVVLTTNSLLEFGRTNNVHMQPSSSLGTIQDAIHPVRVRFHAYRGKQIYRSILLMPNIKDIVIGCTSGAGSMESQGMCPWSQQIMTIARDRLYNAMIKTILQSLEGVTRDIREMQRFARIFWPIYISPLTTGHSQDPSGVIKQKFYSALARSVSSQAQDGHDDAAATSPCQQDACSFCRTMSSLNIAPGEKIDSILEKLDMKGRYPMREIMSKCLFAPVQKLDTTAYPESHSDATYLQSLRDLQGSSLAQLSYMAKFLLLSAYLCQKNRQEQDLALFTNHNKGRRRKTSSEGNNAGDGEGDLFASSAAAQQRLRSFRLTGFPLERMISVFSSILSKYGTESELLKDTTQEDGYLNVTGVGSTQLFACLAELRDLGLLCDMNSGISAGAAVGMGQIDMTAKKYTCNLSDADATGLAQELEIPLQKYLLQER